MQTSGLRLSAIAAASTCAFALAAPAGAQLLSHKDISASIAMTIVQTTIDTCKANGYAVSATVVGRNGEIIVQVRGAKLTPRGRSVRPLARWSSASRPTRRSA